MDQIDYKEELKDLYVARNVDDIIRLISKLIKNPGFFATNRRLVKQGKLSAGTLNVQEVAAALINELEEEIEQSGDVISQSNYFELTEKLKVRFNEDVADIYINTKIPNEFLHDIRMRQDDKTDAGKLSEELVNRYKNELVRIEDGRRAVVETQQQHSNFPIKNVIALSELIEQLHIKLKSNNRYLSIKPYLLNVLKSADIPPTTPTQNVAEVEEVSNHALFATYVTTGQEPSLSQQVLFRVEMIKLFQLLWKRSIISVKEHKQIIAQVTHCFHYQGEPGLSRRARQFLDDLLADINADQVAIMKKLAQTFVDEYHHAEQQMRVHHRMIESELANTTEFLKQLSENSTDADEEKEEKTQKAMEKIFCLKDVFQISPIREQTAASTPFHELERTALGLSTVIPPSQITDWIRIYSILFSNSEFLSYTNEKIDFSIMRKYISDLTTYHLIQSVSELKLVINHSFTVPSEENKPDHFRQFGEILKAKLQGLIHVKKEEVKSFQQMIQELDFINNDTTQYVIAETFKGFQAIADAFNSTVNDYFVRDHEKLLKESRELYGQI
ncbi:MAG: hypothetical protein L3J28_08345 [Candidatus Polarisedimenticolaceae bacterium]|nr:hypothetical protein [Candidatus Polarisedimenticolaceae bacterium]